MKPPCIPEAEFDDAPDDEQWDVLVVEDGEVSLYEDGDCTPLEEITGREQSSSPLADL